MNNYYDKIEQLKEKIDRADALVIGAGAGLSTSAGFTYSGERFDRYFSDFEKKYQFHDMYSGGFYPYETLEEYWTYWSRYIYINRYMDAPKPVYRDLLKLVHGKDYFVLTTNVDHCFQKAGFDKKRLFYTQGDYGLFQCSKPCHDQTYDNEDIVRKMVLAQGYRIDENGDLVTTERRMIPTDLIPVCLHCGRPMTMNLRADDTFVEDEGWHQAANRYQHFLRTRKNLNIVFLEFGTGYNTPGIIKYPFWQMTAENKNATFATVNLKEAFCMDSIQKQSVCIEADCGKVIKDLLGSEVEA